MVTISNSAVTVEIRRPQRLAPRRLASHRSYRHSIGLDTTGQHHGPFGLLKSPRSYMKKIIPILLLLTCIEAHAKTGDLSNQCLDKATTLEQKSNCYQVEITKQKKRLNTAYSRLVKDRDPASLAALNVSQKDWIKWRDDNYNFLADHVAGEADTVLVISDSFLLNAISSQADLLEGVAAAEGR